MTFLDRHNKSATLVTAEEVLNCLYKGCSKVSL